MPDQPAPRPFRRATFVVVLALSCGLTRPSFAQSSTGQNIGGLDVSLSGTLLSSITLILSGSVNPTSGTGTTVTGAGTSGTIHFGTVNLDTVTLNTGELFRIRTGQAQGAYLVATLRIETRFSGGGGPFAAIDVQRTNPCGAPQDVPCGAPGALFFATPRTNGLPFPRWNQYPDNRYGQSVFAVPDASYVPGTGNITNTLANGASIDHQVAVWIPDSQSAGFFSTVLTYTATRL